MAKGDLGGPMADLAQLVGEEVAVERVQMEHKIEDGAGSLRVGEGGSIISADMHPYKGPDGTTTTLRDSIFSTVPGSPAYVGVAEHQKVDAAAVRPAVGVRRQAQRDPVRLEAELHGLSGDLARGSAPRAGHRARRVPPVVLWAIAGAWLLALLATATGKGPQLHHDALIEGSLPFGVALVLFVIAWQAMIAAMMLPSSLPMIRLVAVTAGRQARPRRVMAAFIGGYALIWTLFGYARVLRRRARARGRRRDAVAVGAPVADRRLDARDRRAPSSSARSRTAACASAGIPARSCSPTTAAARRARSGSAACTASTAWAAAGR